MRFSTLSALILLVTNVMTIALLIMSNNMVVPTHVNVDNCRVGEICTAKVSTK